MTDTNLALTIERNRLGSEIDIARDEFAELEGTPSEIAEGLRAQIRILKWMLTSDEGDNYALWETFMWAENARYWPGLAEDLGL